MSIELSEIPKSEDYEALFGFMWTYPALSSFDSIEDFRQAIHHMYWNRSDNLRDKLSEAYKAHDAVFRPTQLKVDEGRTVKMSREEIRAERQIEEATYQRFLSAFEEVKEAEDLFIASLYRLRVAEAMVSVDYELAYSVLQEYRSYTKGEK